MLLATLTEAEKRVVFECLKCVASGNVILHDWEFQTVFGIEVSELKAVFDAWPNVDDFEKVVALAINNSMNNLLGYPHHHYKDWDKYIPVPIEEVARVFQKWRGERIRNYFEGTL